MVFKIAQKLIAFLESLQYDQLITKFKNELLKCSNSDEAMNLIRDYFTEAEQIYKEENIQRAIKELKINNKEAA